MQSGWWWLREPEELEAVARALHPRGIREKALHKHLTKHKEFLREVCLRSTTGEAARSPLSPAPAPRAHPLPPEPTPCPQSGLPAGMEGSCLSVPL